MKQQKERLMKETTEEMFENEREKNNERLRLVGHRIFLASDQHMQNDRRNKSLYI